MKCPNVFHATFERQADRQGGIYTGNVFGTVQRSSFIRPETQTECNGFTFAPGELRRSDMDGFSSERIPNDFVRKIYAHTERHPAILYRMQHYRGQRRIVHGYILTDSNGRTLATRVVGPTWRSHEIVSRIAATIGGAA